MCDIETILSSAFAAALELLESRASEQSFLELLEQVYGATGSDDAAFAAAAGSLQQLLGSGGELGIQVKTLDSADMNGAMGAYSSTGLDGVPVIYINTSLLSEGSDPELLQRVLLEEIGHHFDILLNGSIDTTGDEGELFADLITNAGLDADQIAAINTQNDWGTVQVDGQTVVVEQLVTATGISSTTLGAIATTQAINRATAQAISVTITYNGVNNHGADILIAAYNRTTLIGWTVYNRISNLDAGSANATATLPLTFNLAQFNPSFSSGGLNLRAWQGTAGGTTAVGTASNIPPATTNGTSATAVPFNVVRTTANANDVAIPSTADGGSVTWTATSVDAVAPTALVAISSITTDTGTSSTDFITSDTTLTVAGTNGTLGSAEKVQISTNGTTWSDVTVATSTSWTYTDPTTRTSSFTYQIRVIDTAGNVGNTASQAITIDTTATNAPTITSVTDDVGTITGTLTSGGRTDDTNLTVKVTLPTTGTLAVAGDTIQLYNSTTALGTAYTLLADDITNKLPEAVEALPAMSMTLALIV